MATSRLFIVVSLETSQLDREVVAHCPELDLTDHGETEELAIQRLRANIAAYIRHSAEKGLLWKFLSDRGLLTMEREPMRPIHVPIPVPPIEILRAAIH